MYAVFSDNFFFFFPRQKFTKKIYSGNITSIYACHVFKYRVLSINHINIYFIKQNEKKEYGEFVA